MPTIERLGGLNDRRCWAVNRIQPCDWINIWAHDVVFDLQQCVPEITSIGANRARESIGVQLQLQLPARCVSRKQDWYYDLAMALPLEILQVERVVKHLVQRMRRIPALADLELNNNDDAPEEQNDVRSSPHPGNGVFQEDVPVHSVQRLTKNFELSQPCVSLRLFKRKFTFSTQVTEHFLITVGKEFPD